MQGKEYHPKTPLRTCEIASDLAGRLGVRDGEACRLRAGLRSIRVRLAVNPELRPSSLAMPRDVRRALALPRGLRTNVVRAGTDLRLGPVVGVFVNPVAARHAAQGRAGFRLVELMKANEQAGCILYIFSSEDVTWSPPEVNGAYYDRCRNEWRRRPFPLPDVLYDRGGGFTPAQRPLAAYLRRQLNALPGIKRFNGQHYFDKWDLYRRLSRHAPLGNHLPETALYAGREDLEAMLGKYGRVYLKSTLGSNGRDVMRVIAGRDGYTYNCCRTELQDGSCPDLASLETVIRDFFGRRQTVVQAGIDLLTYQDALIDLRVLAARDAGGAWRIVGMPVRVARAGCAVTSTRSGSTVHRFLEFFRTMLLYDEARLEDLRARIEEIVFMAIRAIEDEYGGFGELGIDLGIDRQDKIWFIEANAKPGKDTIRLEGEPGAIGKAFLYPLQYCRMLAGFADALGRTEAITILALKREAPASKKESPGRVLHAKHKWSHVHYGSSEAGPAVDPGSRFHATATVYPHRDSVLMSGRPRVSQGSEPARYSSGPWRTGIIASAAVQRCPQGDGEDGPPSPAPRTMHVHLHPQKPCAVTRIVTKHGACARLSPAHEPGD
ncbi:MAG: YheC/YheD family protein [Patescibacteria group bacterium]